MNDVMYSSKSELWGTPQQFFDELNKEFGFDLDPCALPSNAKCDRFFTPEEDGLAQNWGGGKSVLQSTLRKGYIKMGA